MSNTMAVKAKEAEPATPQRPVPEFDPAHARIQVEGFVWKHVFLRAPVGMILDDLKEPSVFRRIQQSKCSLRKLDRVTVIAADESWICDCIVADADRLKAVLSKPAKFDLAARFDRLYSDDSYRVEWDGAFFSVIRRRDDHVMNRLATPQAAEKYISEQYPPATAMTGRDIVPVDLAGIHALRAAGDDRYWTPAVQEREVALIAEEQRPETKALASIKRLESELADPTTLTATFDQLPPAVIEACGHELLAGVPIWPGEASWEAQANFRTLPEGRELMRAWGSDAPIKLSLVRERIVRTHARLSDEDSAALSEWFNGLETDEAKAVLGLLAGA